MASPVYFANTHCRSSKDNNLTKIKKLCRAIDIASFVKPDDLTAIKLHFGEHGNDTYLHPLFARTVVDQVHALGAKAFLTDTTTLYSGSRSNAIDHLHTAYAHGFAYSNMLAPVIIADGLDGQNEKLVPVNLKHFKNVRIATEITKAQSMIMLSHFKGHEMAGFGGAIKNLAMGCASFLGKRDQHNTKLAVNQQTCVACGQCIPVCPATSIHFNEAKRAAIDTDSCLGCFECITVCQTKAIDIDWETDLPLFMERMTEYAYGAVQGKQGRIGYINAVINVTPDCDCVGWSDTPLVPNIGLLASTDPIALDQACFDLVKQAQGYDGTPSGEDKFTARWDKTYGLMQLTYGEAIGLGSTEYELIEI